MWSYEKCDVIFIMLCHEIVHVTYIDIYCIWQKYLKKKKNFNKECWFKYSMKKLVFSCVKTISHSAVWTSMGSSFDHLGAVTEW